MKNKSGLVIAGMLLLSATIAQASETHLKLDGKPLELFRDAEKHLTLSKGCVGPNGSFNCKAFSSLKQASLSKLKPQAGGANPGARICGVELQGEVVIARDEKGNQSSFCRFSDGSLISSGSLLYYGRQNDLKNQ